MAVLAAMFLIALGANQIMTYLSQQAQRDREGELVRVGQIYLQAIGDYYESSPGAVKRWPRSLQDLVEDNRFVTIRRHLRKVYADPVLRSSDWGLVIAADGGISGVFSKAEGRPIRGTEIQLNAKGRATSLPAASRYSDWQFIYSPPLSSPTKR